MEVLICMREEVEGDLFPAAGRVGRTLNATGGRLNSPSNPPKEGRRRKEEGNFDVRRLLLLRLLIQDIPAGALDPVAACSSVRCRPGRECRVLSSGAAECVCASSCAAGRGKSVCGSDGVLYESHCELHREACITGEEKGTLLFFL